MNNWIDALIQANKQPAFTDRLKRTCKELPNLKLTFTDNYQQPLRTVRELGWIYPTNEELKSIMLSEENQHTYTYSKHIHEQLPETTALLKENPQTRRAIIHLTDAQHSKQQKHKPCMIALYVAIRNQELHVTMYARSIDLFIGLPANLYQTHIVAQQLAQQLNKPLASITFLINSAHIFQDYEQQLEHVIRSN